MRGLFLRVLSFCHLILCHSRSPLLLSRCFTLLQCLAPDGCGSGDARPARDATRANAPLTALTFCQHFSPLFKGVTGKVCRGLRQATYRGKFESSFLSCRSGGGGVKLLFPSETMGSCGATCSGAHMNGRALGCVRGVSGPGSPSQSPFPSASQ